MVWFLRLDKDCERQKQEMEKIRTKGPKLRDVVDRTQSKTSRASRLELRDDARTFFSQKRIQRYVYDWTVSRKWRKEKKENSPPMAKRRTKGDGRRDSGRR